MNPNHYLAVAIDYLYTHRPDWPASVAVGKTAVSSSIIDRVVAGLGRKLIEVPVGFKWFVDGLIGGTIGFGGESRRGRRSCAGTGRCGPPTRTASSWRCWPRRSSRSPARPPQRYEELADEYGAPVYARVDAPANREQKARLAKLSAEQVTATELAGEPITAKLTTAPGNGAALAG